MSPLLVYRTAAESMTFTYAAIAGWLVAHAVMEARQYPLSGLGAGPAPDLWFGYTPDRLNGYYGEIGEGGRRVQVSELGSICCVFLNKLGGCEGCARLTVEAFACESYGSGFACGL